MKRWLTLAGIVALGLAAVVVSERRKVDTAASPSGLLYLIADSEQELTRLPMRFTRMSDEDEISAGNEIVRGYFSGPRPATDSERNEIEPYLKQVGARLAARAHRRLPYKFYYLADRTFVNAFALPGGHVFIGEGLLALMESEDELAAVLGHELEHIDHYHCAERLQKEQALRKIPLGGLLGLPLAIFQAGYSKDQELEADREGTRLAVEAGYSANGAIRLFETFQRLFDKIHGRATTPRDEVSQVARDALEGYFRSHPLPAERIAQVKTMIASAGWEPRTERDLTVAYIFWTERAQQALDRGKYAQAQQLAGRSLQVHPDSKNALTVLAQAKFAQADFAGAAESYRQIMDLHGWSIELAEEYALSLSAAHRPGAANEFLQWMDSVKGDTEQLRIPSDGLLILAGDPGPARKVQALLRADLENLAAPRELSDLSWWWYLAGDYPAAAELQQIAVQRQPHNLTALVRLAWIEIELRRLTDALRTIDTAEEIDTHLPEKTMMPAVARWQAQEHDLALRDFEAVAKWQPAWTNPHWVQALYSPLVVQSMQEMQIERERRRKGAPAVKP
ncbi:MAG: M48 family metalloprotease [Acidipila sp.]|nr:M48 family metalloprotease [Acidipila sp.]